MCLTARSRSDGSGGFTSGMGLTFSTSELRYFAMHYTQDGVPILPHYIQRRSLKRQVQNECVPAVPADTFRDVDRPLPLRHGVSIDEIVLECLPHATAEPWKSAAVYVLECRRNARALHDIAIELRKSRTFWDRDKAATARRRIYVGMTVNLVRRLYDHLNNSDEGGDFPSVHPPVRVLGVFWFRSHELANRAEELIADGLQKRFSDDYVVQL